MLTSGCRTAGRTPNRVSDAQPPPRRARPAGPHRRRRWLRVDAAAIPEPLPVRRRARLRAAGAQPRPPRRLRRPGRCRTRCAGRPGAPAVFALAHELRPQTRAASAGTSRRPMPLQAAFGDGADPGGVRARGAARGAGRGRSPPAAVAVLPAADRASGRPAHRAARRAHAHALALIAVVLALRRRRPRSPRPARPALLLGLAVLVRADLLLAAVRCSRAARRSSRGGAAGRGRGAAREPRWRWPGCPAMSAPWSVYASVGAGRSCRSPAAARRTSTSGPTCRATARCSASSARGPRASATYPATAAAAAPDSRSCG